MNDKRCSICGNTFSYNEFTYGNRENRSYCRKCDKEERQAYVKGGVIATKEYREAMWSKWKKACVVCNKWFEQDQFTYGNRDNNSYCKACAKGYGEHYTKGGTMATRKWLDDMRGKWK